LSIDDNLDKNDEKEELSIDDAEIQRDSDTSPNEAENDVSPRNTENDIVLAQALSASMLEMEVMHRQEQMELVSFIMYKSRRMYLHACAFYFF